MKLYREARDRFEQRDEGNFCVPMAIGMITDRDPLDVNDDMIDDGIRKPRQGVRKQLYSRWLRDHYRVTMTDVTRKYNKEYNRITLGKLQKRLDPSRNYLIGIDGHVLASRRGVIEDWTSGRKFIVHYVEEMKENGIKVSDFKVPSDYMINKNAGLKAEAYRLMITEQGELQL